MVLLHQTTRMFVTIVKSLDFVISKKTLFVVEWAPINVNQQLIDITVKYKTECPAAVAVL